jgi:transcriptional regulator with XRE-family HTH domain
MGLSQAEMARRMGVSVATIQKWESGKSRRDTLVEFREFDDFAELVTRGPEDVSNLFLWISRILD